MCRYLTDVEEGGETTFPTNSEWIDPSIPQRLEKDGVQFSECAKGHVAAKPKAGDAVLFYSYHFNGSMDMSSMHTGCPVIRGVKYAAPVWIHVNEWQPPLLKPSKPIAPRDPGVCEDLDDRCGRWASSGECDRNPEFMLGKGSNSMGACRKSCGACTACGYHDLACVNGNRRKGGFLELTREELDWLGVEWRGRFDPSPEL